MTLAAEIIDRARDTLADPNAERWSEARLLRLLDEGQKSIARHFEVLRGSFDVALEVGESMYSLPSNLWRITRISTPDCALPMFTYHDMDSQYCSWETKTGSSLEAVIYDERNLHEIRVYPTPDSNFTADRYDTDTDFGVLVDVNNEPTQPLFGITSNASFEQGVVSSFNSPFGVLVDIETKGIMVVQYIKDPDDLVSSTQELQVPQMYDTALKDYIIGHAFLDDLDTQYQNKGNMHIQMYEREVARLGTTQRQHNGVRKGVHNQKQAYRGFQ